MRRSCLPRRLFFLLIISIPAAVCYLQEYADCHSPLRLPCGGEVFDVSYPFMAAGREEYCAFGGHYNLSCQNGTLVIEISSRSYQVKRINYQDGILNIADLELAQETCPLPYDNTSLEPWFEYTGDDLNLTLHYNCTSPLSSPLLQAFPCFRQSYFTLDPPDPMVADLLRRSCSSAIRVPLARANIAEYLDFTKPESFRDAVAKGFDVKWTAGNNWCSDCLGSGGACGYDSSTQEAQICFCPYNVSSSSCPLPPVKGVKPCPMRSKPHLLAGPMSGRDADASGSRRPPVYCDADREKNFESGEPVTVCASEEYFDWAITWSSGQSQEVYPN